MGVESLCQACEATLNLKNAELSPSYYYDSLPQCVIDAVFSIGAKYTSTTNVVKSYCAYYDLRVHNGGRDEKGDKHTISQLIDHITAIGMEKSADVIFQNHQRTSTRSGILKADAVLRFAMVLQMRSKLSNDIFQDELLSLYQEKNLSYQQVRDTAMEAMGRLIREMKSGLCDSPVIAGQMESLAEMLSEVKGKKVYGYLKKPVKVQVDAIVDELARLPEVAECYEHWNRLRDELERYYKDTPREHKPLSQQQEFKAIKNMVIREAEELRLGAFTFEDASMMDEMDEDQEEVSYAWSSRWQMAEAYQNAKEILSEYENTEAEKAEQVRMLEQLWNAGFTVAAHLLGKCWRDGMGVLPDDGQAEVWFRRAAEAGHDFAQYTLGKLLQSQKRMDEAVFWYEEAAAQDNPYAAYRLGKLYLQGEQVPKDAATALAYLKQSAWQGNQYAQYTLGKLYLTGQDVARDPEQAYNWFWESAAQGNEYAQFFLDHIHDNRRR